MNLISFFFDYLAQKYYNIYTIKTLFEGGNTGLMEDISIIMMSTGVCKTADARDILEDILGYTEIESKELVFAAPTIIARQLTELQALYIAQALIEYGMELMVMNTESGEFLNPDKFAAIFVFDHWGNYVPEALRVFMTLSDNNRCHQIEKINHPEPKIQLYVPIHKNAAPPHIKRGSIPHLSPELKARHGGPKGASPQLAPKLRHTGHRV